MASIPLLCKICPRDPKFSDISHLLTHVASKGHLSHYFKAQVRSRQDASVRQRLDEYDNWYETNNIERFLSQRMALKETKSRRRHPSPISETKPAASQSTRGRRKQTKATPATKERGSQVSGNQAIDPQLDYLDSAVQSLQGYISPSNLQSLDLAISHRHHVPRMLTSQTESPEQSFERQQEFASNSKSQAQVPISEREGKLDHRQSPASSPSRSEYPDPSLFTVVPAATPSECPHRVKTEPCEQHQPDKTENDDCQDVDLVGDATECTPSTNSTTQLKGIRWPGMDLFDSAYTEARRMRNQKKDEAVLELMEAQSNVVEPLEQIYFPEWKLKKERTITGMVESSPFKDATPPPKRQRAKSRRQSVVPCQDGSPLPRKSVRAHKILGGDKDSQAATLNKSSRRALSELAPSPVRTSQGLIPRGGLIDEEDLEWKLTAGDLAKKRKRRFDIYNEETSSDGLQAAQSQQSATRSLPYLNQTRYSDMAMLSAEFTPKEGRDHTNRASHRSSAELVSRNHDGAHQHMTHLFDSGADKENWPPHLDEDGHPDQDTGTFGLRSTQRYFSVTGSGPPQFFSSLPPHMDFGGFVGPNHGGASFNPLNPYLPHYRN